LVFGVPPSASVSDVINGLIEEFRKCVFSSEACAVFYNGILIPDAIRAFGEKAKSEVVSELEAIKLARDMGFLAVEITGKKGIVGALAGIAYYDMGIECVSFPNDPAISKIRIPRLPDG
jgi:tRNA(Ile2) C34 agmatinyltransferase TiaS